MEKFQDGLMRLGTWASENKYLSSIKDAFQTFMPFTIIGAIGILWSNVLVNDSTGLGAIFKPIMALKVLNPAFDALNFATISVITIGITILVGIEMGRRNKVDEVFAGILALGSLLTVTQSSMDIVDKGGNLVETISSSLFSSSIGSSGMFTGMIVAIVAVELFTALYKVDGLKIKLPEQVPPQIGRSFEYLIPGLITMIIISLIGLGTHLATGNYLNDLIFNLIQTPLLKIGGSLPGILAFSFLISLFWAVGLHGDNMVSGVFQPIVVTLITQNQEAVMAGKAATNIVNWSWYRIFSCTGGTGMVLGLALAIFIVGRRPENRSIASVAIAANMFNIMEVEAFGLPIVLNPILIIPFIAAPIVSLIFGYFITAVGLCPVMYVNAPWTMPPFLYAFVASGGNFIAGLWQLAAVAIATVIYIPFIRMYERQQAIEAGER